MWTRIQILFIGIATILTGSMFFCNMATIIGAGGTEITVGYHEKTPYLIMLIMLFTAQVAALACAKVRFLQMRVCVIAALLQIGFQIWLGVDFLKFHSEMVFSFTMLFPFVSAVLDAIAVPYIMSDEMVVQTYNKLHHHKKSKK